MTPITRSPVLLVFLLLLFNLYDVSAQTACADCAACLSASVNHVLISSSFSSLDYQGCTTITAVTFANTVTEIPDQAFQGATSLNSVTFSGGTFANLDIGNSVFQGTAITNLILPTGLTKIITNAFRDMSVLDSVTIPNTVTEIQGNSFLDIETLTTVTFSSDTFTSLFVGYTAFGGTSISSLSLPVGMSKISIGSFQGMSELETVTIPHTVTTIEDEAFAGFYSLVNVTFSGIFDPTLDLGEEIFSGTNITELVLPVGLTEIRSDTFQGMELLTSVTIPYTVTEIYTGAFAELESLTYVTFSGTFTSLTFGGYVFEEAPVISLSIPAGVTTIGQSSFQYMSELKTVTIPHTVTEIIAGAFSSLDSLTTVTFTGTFTTLEIGSSVFEQSPVVELILPAGLEKITTNALYDMQDLTTLSIPHTVTEIQQEAFLDLKSLTSVIFSGTFSALTIGDSAFVGTALTGPLVLPAGLTDIGGNSFKDLEFLTDVTIPDSVIFIGDEAFKGSGPGAGSCLIWDSSLNSAKGGSRTIGTDAFVPNYFDCSTDAPSISPSALPTTTSTVVPSAMPSIQPTVSPSAVPSVDPSAAPSIQPTVSPSVVPSVDPSAAPSIQPSVSPSVVPSAVMSAAPSIQPTVSPTAVPSVDPSAAPSIQPSVSPSVVPSADPSAAPSNQPTVSPSAVPSVEPTASPSLTFSPSVKPTKRPTAYPSMRPSRVPTARPSLKPTPRPSIVHYVDISFDTTLSIQNATVLELDELSKEAVTVSVSRTLNLDEEKVVFLTQETVAPSRRRLGHFSLREATSYEIKVTVRVVASTGDFIITETHTTGDNLYAMLLGWLNTAVSTAALMELIRDVSADLGASGTVWVSEVAYDTTPYVVVTEDTKKDDLTTGEFSGIVIGVVVAFLLLLSCAWFILRPQFKPEKDVTHHNDKAAATSQYTVVDRTVVAETDEKMEV